MSTPETGDPRQAGDPRPVEDMSFEEALAALEDVVSRLESGEVPLEASIALYERGTALKRHCEQKLADAELKVQKIVAGADGTPRGTESLDMP
ncbi:MAG: exodeoxyribonuclease VII small subunit [Paracoccaceae bacterium]